MRLHMKQDSKGFTIVELMIATMVFSVVLLVITFGVVYFTTSYYRGVNGSTTQSTAQDALDTISQAVQFSGISSVAPDASQTFFCAGTKLFVYQLGVQYKGDPTATTGLYMLNKTGSNCAYQAPAANDGGTELLGKNMRVLGFNMTKVTAGSGSSGDVWSLGLRIAYGDDDLLCSPTVGNCSNNNVLTTSQFSNSDVICKVQAGSQFCTIANLSTVAQQRVVN